MYSCANRGSFRSGPMRRGLLVKRASRGWVTGMSGFAFKLAPLCVQGGVYSQDVKGLSAARRDALSVITADHPPHSNGAAKCPGYFCVSLHLRMHVCACFVLHYKELNSYSRNEINPWPSCHILVLVFIFYQLLSSFFKKQLLLTLSSSRSIKGSKLKRIRCSQEDV